MNEVLLLFQKSMRHGFVVVVGIHRCLITVPTKSLTSLMCRLLKSENALFRIVLERDRVDTFVRTYACDKYETLHARITSCGNSIRLGINEETRGFLEWSPFVYSRIVSSWIRTFLQFNLTYYRPITILTWTYSHDFFIIIPFSFSFYFSFFLSFFFFL